MTTVELANAITDGLYAETLDAEGTVLVRVPDGKGGSVDLAVRRATFAPDLTLLLEVTDATEACKRCAGRGWYLERFSDSHRTQCADCRGTGRQKH